MTRPSFNAAWAAAQKIYDPANSGAKVAKMIGGAVATNINSPDPKSRWNNTCAVRISYILNQSGVHIPQSKNKTVSGADKSNYFYRVADVIEFLKQRWGRPDLILQYPPSGGGPLVAKKGLILFQVSGWGDAAGHATLWDGKGCYDHCYFNEPGAAYRTDKANFWSLS
jgi:hypothetical protein